MQIITNDFKLSHLNCIKNLIENSDEAIVCVAFLKNSGLNLILDELSSNITFYIGTDYYITEPSAIKKLIEKGHTVFLTTKAKSTFHPKIYYFRKGKDISILTGSANLTGGGLATSFETSFLIKTESGSIIDEDFHSMIAIYLTHSRLISSEGDLELSQYERKYEIYRQKHNKADKEFKEEIESFHTIDVKLLDKYFNEYLEEGGHERFLARVNNYKRIKKLLNEIVSVKIESANKFLEYYEVIANAFYSSNLLRGKTIYAKGYIKIIEAIKYIKENSTKAPNIVYSEARSKILSVDRFGVNGLTEIMNTYNPTLFSIANGRTIKSLADLGFVELPKPVKKNFDGDSYSWYNNLIKEIAVSCKASNLGHVDDFLSWYFDKYLKE